ncbi:MAG: hypothetical protein IKR48_02315 [Kiritimatiellae bacterium]|nr:hypothetical protein [Kiritimatiellia bacterium]
MTNEGRQSRQLKSGNDGDGCLDTCPANPVLWSRGSVTLLQVELVSFSRQL